MTQPTKTTEPGYENRNRQLVVRKTDKFGTDHLQRVYELRCQLCGYSYGANGSDIFERTCPNCQRGKPGIDF